MEKAGRIRDSIILVMDSQFFEDPTLNLDKWNNATFSLVKLPKNLCTPLPSFIYQELLPELKKMLCMQKKWNFFNGNSHYKKSHILMILNNSLKERKEFSVINIHNSEYFIKNQLEFVFQEIYSWFYLEIQESAWLKILMNLAIQKYYEKKLTDSFITYILNECIFICNSKNKKLIYIQDSLDNEFIDNNLILRNFSNQIDYFFITINSNDHDTIPYFIQHEIKTNNYEIYEFSNIIENSEAEKKKIIKQFFQKIVPEIEEFLFSKTKGEYTCLTELSK